MTILDTRPQRRSYPRIRGAAILVGTALFGALLALAPIGSTTPASAAAAFQQCNGTDNAAAAEVQCSVTIENTLDRATGVESSIVTVLVCIGAPAAPICGAPVTSFASTSTTVVDQCNGSANAGGSVVRCDVVVTNVVTNASTIDQATVTPATINQCAGSGAGGGASTLNCDSYETTTTATVTQCNGSVNGGGAPTRVNCTVGPSTQTTLLPVTINQCNASANGGGALMFCNARIVNDVRLAVVPVTPVTPVTPGVGGGGTGAAAPVVTVPRAPGIRADGRTLAATGTDLLLPAALGLLAVTLGGGLAIVSVTRRGGALGRR
jgi:hypothetical protein